MGGLRDRLAPLLALCAESGPMRVRLFSSPHNLVLPSFQLIGPGGGGDRVRIGFFAGIHGDEPAGVEALLRWMQTLARQPDLIRGYDLFFYPVCNPGGWEKGHRLSAGGLDLNREFWRDSAAWEVRTLEREIRGQQLHGLVSLHSDDTSDGVYGFVRGAVLTRALLEPALDAAEKFLPRNQNRIIDGFPAEGGIVSQCYDGVLTSPPDIDPLPFEIILETPGRAELTAQVDAFVAALDAILDHYQKLLAFAANL